MSDARPPGATGRIVIEGVRPRTTTGRHPAKAVAGLPVRVRADVFRDGHDHLAARVRWRPVGETPWTDVAMAEGHDDEWEATFVPECVGPHEFVVEAWTDRVGTWCRDVELKRGAGQEIGVELEEGARLLEDAAARVPDRDRARVLDAAAAIRSGDLGPAEHLDDLFGGVPDPRDATVSEPLPLWVDRERAQVGAWYELFPRSEGGFRGTIERLPAIRAMGFDVVYLPPVHPIGHTFRKGADNALVAGPGDVGSPWAIGSEEGGHAAVHPDLGTFDDFDRLVAETRRLGMEVALDYALQCSPDHPWVREHPEWFHHRPDGTIKYAENPPKKYQDIYPINFWPEHDADRAALWDACAAILELWIDHGVRIFRVDNPHTKPLAFWEWLIERLRAAEPDVVLLAEAFTRPKMMAKLAEIGFSQSYTYFTWRVTGEELRAYLTELTAGPTADFMRPSFWPNTPDILSGPLRGGPPAAFALRLVLAALLVPSYGIYRGYELCENEPASETNEEYLHSEKYEIRRRDPDRPGSLVPLVAALNDIRRRHHRCFAELTNLRFHHADNPELLVWSKQSAGDTMLVVVNLDPHRPQDGTLWIDLGALGIGWDAPYDAHDELRATTYRWRGPSPYVRLDPAVAPAHVLHLREVEP